MTKVLLVIGGILNSPFFLLYRVLSYQIHNLTQLAAGYRGLLQALNVGGVLFIFFFAFVSFFCQKELMGSRLGRVVLLLVSALFLSRAAEEFFLFQFSPVILVSCTLTGLIYVALLVIASRKRHSGEFAGTTATTEEREPELVGHL